MAIRFCTSGVLCWGLLSWYALASDPADASSAAVDVYAEAVKLSPLFDSLEFGGFIEATESFSVASQVGGNLTALLVGLGEKVKKGQKLFQVSPLGAGLGYQRHTALSPIDGIVVEQHRSLGEQVELGTPVATVVDMSRLQVTIFVPDDDFQEFQIGKSLGIEVRRGGQTSYSTSGRVSMMSPKADDQTGTYAIRIGVDCSGSDCQSALRLGTLVRVIVKQNERQGILVGLDALQAGGAQVVVVDPEGRARWRSVKLGRNFGANVEILEGLKSGELLVTGFSQRPAEGQQVRILRDDLPTNSSTTTENPGGTTVLD